MRGSPALAVDRAAFFREALSPDLASPRRRGTEPRPSLTELTTPSKIRSRCTERTATKH